MPREKKPKITVWKIYKNGKYLGSTTQKHQALASAHSFAVDGDYMKKVHTTNPMKKTIAVTGHHKVIIKETRE